MFMHYYPHHIGDFIADTARLTDSQCMAYLRLIWHYYDTENPLENDPDSLAFRIGASSSDVLLILKHYFILDGEVWRKTRCDAVISEYRGKADKAKKSAEARWKNAKIKQSNTERNANASNNNANASKNDANQEPITNNQEPIKELKDITPQAAKRIKPEYPDWFNELWKNYPQRAGGNDKKKAFKAAELRIKQGIEIQDLFYAVNRYKNYVIGTGRLNTEYVKQASTFFNSDSNIEELWVIPAQQQGASNGQPRSSLIDRFIQNNYGQQNDNRPMGGDDRVVWGQVVEPVRGDAGCLRAVEQDISGDYESADSRSIE